MHVIDQGSTVLATSPAKLNIQLGILGRRADRFHEIETVMLKVSLYDRLRASTRADGELTLTIHRDHPCISRSIPAGPENLVLKAASLLQHHAGVRFGADLVLNKRIPAEAGLAGGSGNAAASLLALNQLWRLELSRGELRSLASQLGSDVPFFLETSAAAVARGRGERIEPIPIRGPLHCVIVKPRFGLATADVYRAYSDHQPAVRATAAPVIQALANGHWAALGRHLANDLAPAAESLEPELARLRAQLETLCPHGGQMTGSGSALFGICPSARYAACAARRIRAAGQSHAFAAASI